MLLVVVCAYSAMTVVQLRSSSQWQGTDSVGTSFISHLGISELAWSITKQCKTFHRCCCLECAWPQGLLKSEFAAQTGMNLPAMDPLSACWEREEKKKRAMFCGRCKSREQWLSFCLVQGDYCWMLTQIHERAGLL